MKLLISDFEGTLVDFQWKLRESMDEMCEIIKGYNINYDLNLPIERLKNFNYSKLYNYFQKNIEEPMLKKKIMKDFDRIYDFYDMDAAKRWKLKQNVPEILKKLSEQNVKLALCSNVGRKALDIVTEKMKIKKFFDITVSRNDVKFLKPNINGIKYIFTYFQITNTNKHKIFFLGDSVTDIHTAKKSNIPAIIITDQGENSLSEIERHLPEHIVHNIDDVQLFFHN